MTRCGRAFLAALLCLLAACEPSRPTDLPPTGAGPPVGAREGPWQGRGRLHLTWTGGAWSGSVVVRRRERELAIALLADGGVPLAGLVLGPGTARCEPADPDLLRRLTPLLVAMRAAWLAPASAATRVEDHFEARRRSGRMLYAGDPPRLRWLTLPGGAARVDAYRGPSDHPVPHRLTGRADGIAFELRLNAVNPQPAQIPHGLSSRKGAACCQHGASRPRPTGAIAAICEDRPTEGSTVMAVRYGFAAVTVRCSRPRL